MAEKTSTGRLIAAAGGIILIISLFLNWYGISVEGPAAGVAGNVVDSLNIDTSFSGWQSLDVADFIFFLIGILAILPAALDIFDLELELPFDVGLAITIAGVVAVLWVILRIIDKPGGDWISGVGLGLKYGIFVALVGAGLVAFGGFTQRGEAGEVEYAAPAAPGAAPPAPPAPQPPAAAPPAAAPPAAAPPVAPPAAPPAAPPEQQPPAPPAPPAV